MKRPFFVTLWIAVLVTFSYAFTKLKDPEYKNLKILPKDITAQQMDSVMHHYTASLNVNCNFCHVRNDAVGQWDYASDANKHKLVAREMMTMTNEINDKYFPYSGKAEKLSTILTVTCYTCHNAKKEPDVKATGQQNRGSQNGGSTKKPWEYQAATDSTRRQ